MKKNENLKDALARTGDTSGLQHLSPEAQQLTKADITQILNHQGNHSDEVLNSLRKYSKQRLKDGKRIFPWKQMTGIEHTEEDDNTKGGTW